MAVERTDAPFGFRPIHKNGAPWCGEVQHFLCTGDNNAVFLGDPVVLAGSANTTTVSAAGLGDARPGSLPTVVRATAGATNPMVGIVTGVKASDRDSLTYRVNDTERVLEVCTDPDVVFLVQADDAVAATAVGETTQLLFTHAGSTISGLSGAEVDATAGGDATGQFKIIKVHDRIDNPYNSAGNLLEVKINLHQYSTGVGSAGV